MSPFCQRVTVILPDMAAGCSMADMAEIDQVEAAWDELGELIDYVTERVRSASNGQQTPWVARRELFGDFALR